MYNQLNINKFSGLNLESNQTRIEENEAVSMVNMEITENGVLSKRKGFDFVFNASNSHPILEVITYKTFMVFLQESGIYRKSSSGAVEVVSNITVDPINHAMFELNGKLYILTGSDFYEYDGYTFLPVSNRAYIPTLFITSDPKTGAGKEYEQWNLLSNNFKQSFNGDGTSLQYVLCIDTDMSISQVWVDGVLLNYSSYMFKRQNNKSIVEFTSPPSKGIDNVIISMNVTMSETNTYTKKIKENQERINKSTIFSFYGGQNDTRLLLGGQDSIFYRSDVYNVYYFPENYYQSVGDTDEKITGFVTQYDYCVIIKEHSIWSTRFEIDSQGNPLYTTKPLNEQFGSKYKSSIQVIENSPIFLDYKKGLCVINQTNVRDERNVSVISQKINKILLESNYDLTSYRISSADYNNKYFLAINNKIYIYDYVNNLFYLWTTPNNGKIYCMAVLDNTLYISYSNNLLKLTTTNNKDRYFDTSTSKYVDLPISCLWKSKVFSLGSETEYKKIKNLFVSMQADEKTSCTIKYVIDNSAINTLGTTYNYFFNYGKLNYALMSYTSTTFPVTDKHKIKLKKVVYFQIEISNNAIDESLEINSISIEYKVTKAIK